METVELKAFRRKKSTKGAVKQLRREGIVPGIVYGRGKEPLSVGIEERELKPALGTASGSNVLVDLKIDNEAKETVMFKDIQRDILIPEQLLHIDLLRVSLTEKIEVNVPLNLTGEPEGLEEGGIVQTHMREVYVKCLPMEIPDRIDVDISALNIGDSLHVGDLHVPEGVEMLEDEEEVVVTVSAPSMVEEEPEEEETLAEVPEGEEPETPAEEAEDTGTEEES